MTNQEVKLTTEAMVTKQSYVRRSFKDFLVVWQETTEERIDEFQYLWLGTVGEGFGKINIYLERNCRDLYYNCVNNELGEAEEAYDIELMDIDILRTAIKGVNFWLEKYFRKIQAEISGIDVDVVKVAGIINRLG
jgi:hypothetical protein